MFDVGVAGVDVGVGVDVVGAIVLYEVCFRDDSVSVGAVASCVVM